MAKGITDVCMFFLDKQNSCKKAHQNNLIFFLPFFLHSPHFLTLKYIFCHFSSAFHSLIPLPCTKTVFQELVSILSSCLLLILLYALFLMLCPKSYFLTILFANFDHMIEQMNFSHSSIDPVSHTEVREWKMPEALVLQASQPQTASTDNQL